MIPTLPIDKMRVTSARAQHRRQGSIDENPFIVPDRVHTGQSTESHEGKPQPEYETLAQFTKENLIQYESAGKTESAWNEPTAEFDNSKQS